MARATIELHDRSEGAWSAVQDLRAVGLGQGSVASVVMAAEPVSESAPATSGPPEGEPHAVRAVIPGVGSTIITGWLSDEIQDGKELHAEAWLHKLLERASPSNKDIERVVATLRGKGGLVSVRSDERIGSAPTVNEVLKGRGD